MSLTEHSLEWAVQAISDHSDGDLFPRIAEIAAVVDRKSDFAKAVAPHPLTTFKPGAHRRFIVPKDEVSYRQATQLDPQDNIILAALMYQYGGDLEKRRLDKSSVFSYRFEPSEQHGLYGPNLWNEFWKAGAKKVNDGSRVLYCDISDFYNQIAHHTIENQLIASELPNQAIKWIIALLESTTAGVSRGIPVGPHAAHLLAEASMIPIDNSLVIADLDFIRYADDILVFCPTERDAKVALSRLAQTLDKQQRLTLQKHKTKVFFSGEFKIYARTMIEDRAINAAEGRLLGIVDRYSSGDPYATISYSQIDAEDWKQFSAETVQGIVEEYLGEIQIDFIRLRWFYRRLAQVGHPGAVDVTLNNIEFLEPCFASICTYFSSLQSIDEEAWKNIGSRLLTLLETPEVRESEYFRLSLLSLFSRNSKINHFRTLRRAYASSDPFAKREILLAAKRAGAIDWLRELKEDYGSMDYWQQLAFIYCCSDLPSDERKYLVNSWPLQRPFEAVLASWAKNQ